MNFTGTANNLLINLATEQWPYAVDRIATQLQQCLERHQQAEPHFDLTVTAQGAPIQVELFIPSLVAAELQLLPDSQQMLATAQAIADMLQRPVHVVLSKGRGQLQALVKANLVEEQIWSVTQTTAFGKAPQPFAIAALQAPLIIDEVVATLNELPSLAKRLQGDAILIYRDDSGLVANAPEDIQVTVKAEKQLQLNWPEGSMNFVLSEGSVDPVQHDVLTTPAQPDPTLSYTNQPCWQLLGFVESDGFVNDATGQPAPEALQQAGFTTFCPVDASMAVTAPVTTVFGRSMFKKAAAAIQARTPDGSLLPALSVGFSRQHLLCSLQSNEVRIEAFTSELPVQILRGSRFELLQSGDDIADKAYLKIGLSIVQLMNLQQGAHHE
ncbi:hypothetical protein [Rheinheimera sp. F8]|uniref:hypothetical protein n=1 Tax=Rheinheimera sp. F8 TaxID=1763998 RepID=UPI000744B2AE|nr:hypothetical protein [Rheinheimera sp. F8]ALZ76701.1 hypothetical protein ATY27_13665 [Rheinheimera sp. F8]